MRPVTTLAAFALLASGAAATAAAADVLSPTESLDLGRGLHMEAGAAHFALAEAVAGVAAGHADAAAAPAVTYGTTLAGERVAYGSSLFRSFVPTPVVAAAVVPLLPDDGITVRTAPRGMNAVGAAVGASAPALDATGLRADIPGAASFAIATAKAGTAFAGSDAADAATERMMFTETDAATTPFAVAPATAAVLVAADAQPDSGVDAASANARTDAATGWSQAARVAVAAAAVTAPLALIGWALYHRIRGAKTLDSPTRKAIFDAVCQEPGVGVHTVSKSADVSYSTAVYHLDRLVGAGMIVQSSEGNKLRYYKNGGTFNEQERRVLPLLKNAEAMRVFEAIVATPGTYRAELAERLGVTATTINWHLKRLKDLDLILEERRGRSAYLSIDVPRWHTLVEGLMPKLAEHDPDTVHALVGAGLVPQPAVAATPAPSAATVAA